MCYWLLQVTGTKERGARIGEENAMRRRGTGTGVGITTGAEIEIEVMSMIETETMGVIENVTGIAAGIVDDVFPSGNAYSQNPMVGNVLFCRGW